MNKFWIAWIALAASIGAGCHPSTSTPSSAAAGSNPADQNASTTPATHDQNPNAGSALSAIPANLQNDAFHYYGLSRTQPLTYVVTRIDASGATSTTGTGAESVKFTGMQNGKALFDIERTGALEPLGSEHVSLDTNGVTVESTDPGQLDSHPLDMPADLKPGANWKTDYKVTIPKTDTAAETNSADHSVFKVVGTQKVMTKLGNYDAVLVTSEGTDTLNGQSFTLKTQSWYVKDLGAVKITVQTISNNKTTTLQIEAVPGDSK